MSETKTLQELFPEEWQRSLLEQLLAMMSKMPSDLREAYESLDAEDPDDELREPFAEKWQRQVARGFMRGLARAETDPELMRCLQSQGSETDASRRLDGVMRDVAEIVYREILRRCARCGRLLGASETRHVIVEVREGRRAGVDYCEECARPGNPGDTPAR